MAQLRAEVQELRRQVVALSRTTGPADTGTGGSGAAGTAVDPENTVVASVLMRGQVASVSKDRINVRDAETGDLYTLFVGDKTRTTRNGKSVSVQNLSEGTPIQAAFNQLADGDSFATRIQVYPRPQ